MIQIPISPRYVLEIPFNFTGVGIERQGRVRIQNISTAGIPLNFTPGNGYGNPHINHIQLRVVARRHPRRAPPSLLIGHVAPGLTTRLPDFRHRVGSPDLLSGLRVVCGNPAAGIDVIAAGHPDNHFAIEYLRSA